MDTIDQAIINELKRNGRASSSEISKRVNLSVPAVAERIRKLEKAGIINQYTIKLNRQKTGQNLLAFIFMSIDGTDNTEAFRKKIVQYPVVLECHHVAGSYDYLLKVVAKDTATLEDFLTSTLKKINGVANSNTIISLATLKEELNG